MFRFLAYLAPLAVGFGVASALALTAGKPVRRRALFAGGGLALAILVLLAAALPSFLGAWIRVSVLLAALAALAGGLFLLGEGCGLPREASQILSSLAVVALVSSVFWLGPIILDSTDQSREATYGRITAAVAVNPYLVMEYSIFHYNPLHEPALRPLRLHDYQFDWPSWRRTSAGYALFGLVFFGIGWGVRELRRRLSP